MIYILTYSLYLLHMSMLCLRQKSRALRVSEEGFVVSGIGMLGLQMVALPAASSNGYNGMQLTAEQQGEVGEGGGSAGE